MIEIDGSFGEGGGQILRTALALSCLAHKPFRIFHIRKNRRKPGLMPQHLACVRALASISHARVRGDIEGSNELVFEPGESRPGDYSFDIGTAGSTSLLFQALLPPLVFSGGRSRVVLTGGTHVPLSPPFHYISGVFIPMLGGLGIRIQASIDRYGFYPRGGGKILVEIEPAGRPANICLRERGQLRRISGISGVANLEPEIGERQKKVVSKTLSAYGLTADMRVIEVPSYGRGTFVFILADAQACHAGFSSLGERGKRAEKVGEEAAREFLDYYLTGACLDHHLADQIVLYLAVAKGDSVFTVSRITNHLRTNLQVIEIFLGVKYHLTEEEGKPASVAICP